MKEKILLYGRMLELEKELSMFKRLLKKYPGNAYYKEKEADTQSKLDITKALYFGTAREQ